MVIRSFEERKFIVRFKPVIIIFIFEYLETIDSARNEKKSVFITDVSRTISELNLVLQS